MGWNIGLAVIESDVAATIAADLDLDAPEEDVHTLDEACGHGFRDDFTGVGTLDRFTLVSVRWAPDHADVWKRLSKNGRIVAFWLSENSESNTLEIYEAGKRVVAKQDGRKAAWKPKHALEKGAKGHRADYIQKVFENFTGHELTGERVMGVPMRLHQEKVAAIDPTILENLRTSLDAELATPLPSPSSSALDWFNRRVVIEKALDAAWTIDRGVTSEWLERVRADVQRWPDERRELSRARFDAIASGKDDGRAEVFAPLYRSFKLDKGGGDPRFREKTYARVFAHPVASELTRLDLACTHLPAEAAVIVANAARLANLEYLSFDRCFIGDAGVDALARSNVFGKLRLLNLYACRMTSFARLADAPFAATLESLEIGGNGVGAEAVHQLGRFTKLRYLSLRVDETVEIEAARVALASLPALTTLVLSETAVTSAAELARPGLTIHTEWTPIL